MSLIVHHKQNATLKLFAILVNKECRYYFLFKRLGAMGFELMTFHVLIDPNPKRDVKKSATTVLLSMKNHSQTANDISLLLAQTHSKLSYPKLPNLYLNLRKRGDIHVAFKNSTTKKLYTS